MFVKTIRQTTTNQLVQKIFQHLDNIVSKCFHQVLDALVEMHSHYMKLPDKNYQTDVRIKDNLKYASYFQNCFGVLDEIHIDTYILYKKRTSYRNHKGILL